QPIDERSHLPIHGLDLPLVPVADALQKRRLTGKFYVEAIGLGGVGSTVRRQHVWRMWQFHMYESEYRSAVRFRHYLREEFTEALLLDLQVVGLDPQHHPFRRNPPQVKLKSIVQQVTEPPRPVGIGTVILGSGTEAGHHLVNGDVVLRS